MTSYILPVTYKTAKLKELSVPSIVNIGNGVAAESIIDMMSVSHLSVKVFLDGFHQFGKQFFANGILNLGLVS